MSNLKKKRKEKHMTQRELALSVGLNKNTIALYERNERDINNASAITIYRLSKILLCNMEDLLEFPPEEGTEEKTDE